MKPYLLPISLQVIAFLVVVAEIFIPSFGILILISLSLFGYSLYLFYTDFSTTVGMIFTTVDIITIPLILVMGMKLLGNSSLALTRELSKNDGVVSQKKDLEKYIGEKGTSVTVLRPAGIAEIDDQRLDVVTDAEYIDAETPVIVTGVTGNRIVVEKSNT